MKAMQVKKSEIVPVLIARGFTALKSKADLKKVQMYVDEKVPQLDGGDEPWSSEPTPEQKELFEKVARVLKKGKPVEVVDDAKAETNGETSHESNGKTPTKNKEAKGKSPPATEEEATPPVAGKKGKKKDSNPDKTPAAKERKAPDYKVDGWGTREGTNRAKVNSVLIKADKPLSVEEIAKKAKLPNGFFRKHLKALIEAGHVEKTAEGYKKA